MIAGYKSQQKEPRSLVFVLPALNTSSEGTLLTAVIESYAQGPFPAPRPEHYFGKVVNTMKAKQTSRADNSISPDRFNPFVQDGRISSPHRGACWTRAAQDWQFEGQNVATQQGARHRGGIVVHQCSSSSEAQRYARDFAVDSGPRHWTLWKAAIMVENVHRGSRETARCTYTGHCDLYSLYVYIYM